MTNLAIHHYFEFLSLLVSIYCYRRLRNSFMIAFIPGLAVNFFVEVLTTYLSVIGKGHSTIWIYNLFVPLTLLFYTYIFYKFAVYPFQKRLLIGLYGLYLGICLLDYLWLGSLFVFNNKIFAGGGIIQVVFACSYYFQYLQDDDNLKDPKWTSGLWIASGLLIFFTGITIVFALPNFIYYNKLQIGGLPLYQVIPRILCVILYSCLSIAFVTWNPRAEKS